MPPTCALLLLLLTASSAAAQRNTESWPSSTGYTTDVSDKHIPIDPSERCDDVLARFSFAQPGQVVQADFLPFDATGNCEGPPCGTDSASRQPFRRATSYLRMASSADGLEIMRGLFPEGTFSALDSPDPRGTKRWRELRKFSSLMGKKRTAISIVYNNDGNQDAPVLNATITLSYCNIYKDYYTNYPEDAAVFPPIVLRISRGGVNIAPWITLAPSGGTSSTTLRLPRNMVSASIEVINVAVPGAPSLSTQVDETDKQVQVLVDGVTAGIAHIELQRLHEPLPLSFSVAITPMVGRLVDGRTHTFAFKNPHQGVSDTRDCVVCWWLGLCLYIYVDKRANRTSGTLLESSTSGPFQLGSGYNPHCNTDDDFYNCNYQTANSSVMLSPRWV
eukprot:jgi/Chlat1/3365/Chrsp23S03803